METSRQRAGRRRQAREAKERATYGHQIQAAETRQKEIARQAREAKAKMWARIREQQRRRDWTERLEPLDPWARENNPRQSPYVARLIALLSRAAGRPLADTPELTAEASALAMELEERRPSRPAGVDRQREASG